MSQLLFGQLIRAAVGGPPPEGTDPATLQAALAELESSRLPFFTSRPVAGLQVLELRHQGLPEGVRWVMELRGRASAPQAGASTCGDGRLRVEAREGGAFRVDTWCGGEHLRHDIANPLLLDGADRPYRVREDEPPAPPPAPAPRRRSWPPRLASAPGQGPGVTFAAGLVLAAVALYLALRG